MADERVVSTKLEQIEQYHSELKEKQQSLTRTDLLTNTTEQRAVERMFENAIQACSDLAQHIATHDFDFTGVASKEAIRILGQEGVVDEQTMNTLVAAVGFRNVLAHEYGKVDYAEVYQTLQSGLEVYDAFSRQIAQWFQQHERT
ncbi:hypothetical protein A4G99_19585 [Haladaptatus sp. R4]|uniref:type VII toxin-antitoxin system HepT family RNase toxin n=1 Tax=Haladaptatus sp. R4 TaxID=1679489 RepID=UPI0007B4CBE0|nr:DUF86 domain-containing protein [Haladaptatus sp. R4]KZN22655.1 hypothetical protein A4G99_19585 [Haladaptatus sp. R4]